MPAMDLERSIVDEGIGGFEGGPGSEYLVAVDAAYIYAEVEALIGKADRTAIDEFGRGIADLRPVVDIDAVIPVDISELEVAGRIGAYASGIGGLLYILGGLINSVDYVTVKIADGVPRLGDALLLPVVLGGADDLAA